MRSLYPALLCLMCTLPVHGMKKSKALVVPNSHSPSKDLLTARSALENVLITTGPALDKHLKIALRATKRALNDNPNGSTAELASFKAFIMGLQADIALKESDLVFKYLDDVIKGPRDTPLLLRMRQEAIGRVRILADEKDHPLSKFYLVKQLINSPLLSNVDQGLERFEDLITLKETDQKEKNYREHSLVFNENSEILDDIERLAQANNNAHAQYVLAKHHFFLAISDQEENAADPSHELKRALAYAEKSVVGSYEPSKALFEEIQKNLAAYEPKQRSQEDIQAQVLLGPCLADQESVLVSSALEMEAAADQSVAVQVDYQKVQDLYLKGKKLIVEEDDELYFEGLECLKHAARLGNPFAAERVGDELREIEPDLAFVFYTMALEKFRNAPPNSLYRLAGCFKLSALEWNLHVLSQDMSKVHSSNGVVMYQHALACGKEAAFEIEVYNDDEYKKYIAALAGTVHSLEKYFVSNKHTIDTFYLEFLNTSGVLRYMERFRKDISIQNVLINVFGLRAHLGRGFLLKERTALAHQKKALQFILYPVQAGNDAFDDPVKDDLLLKEIAIDSLPEQHRIIYLDALLGVIEHWVQQEHLTQQNADYVCKLFSLVDQALRSTKDMHLKNLHHGKYRALFPTILKAARTAQSGEHLLMVGCCYREAGMNQDFLDLTIEADPLLTRALQEQGGKTAERQKQLALVKVTQARALDKEVNMEQVRLLYKRALELNPTIDVKYEFARVLMDSGQSALRQEGVALMEQLSRSGKHRPSLQFMADCYAGFKIHLMKEDLAKAVDYLQKLIIDDSKDFPNNRAKLANIYMAQARAVMGHERNLLLAKARDLIKSYKDTEPAIHCMYIDILVLQDKSQEIFHEVTQYVLREQATVEEILEVARMYINYSTNRTFKNKLSKKLRERGLELLERIKDSSEEAHRLLLSVLFADKHYAQLSQEIATYKGADMECIHESYKARALLDQQGFLQLTEVVEHCQRAFDAFDRLFVRQEVDRVQTIVNLIQAAGAGEVVPLANNMKQPSLEQLEKMLALLHVVIMQSEDIDVMKRALAYHSYFSVKLTLLWLGTKNANFDNVVTILTKAAENVQAVDDLVCKERIMKVAQDQVIYWLNGQYGQTLAVRAHMATKLVFICANVAKNSKEANISNLLYSIVQTTNTALEALQVSSCSEEDKNIIKRQQQVLTLLQNKLRRAQ
ncbi:MAG: hypothetical protein AB7F19_01205 [Candidatus Babeliales bacterium]